ncbi:peptidoglycan-binding protein [Iningainema tapete]
MEYLAYSNMVIANEGENIDIEYSLSEMQSAGKKQLKSAWLTFALLGVLLAIFFPNQATATYRGPGRYYVNTNGSCLNIRTGPSTSYPSVACYRNGSRLPRVIGYRNGFAYTDNSYYASTNWMALSSRNYNDGDYYTSRNRNTSSYRNDYPYNTDPGSYIYNSNRSFSSSRNYNPDYYDRYSYRSDSNSGISIGGADGNYSSVRSRRLAVGSRGQAVRQVQAALGLRTTGYYDNTTYYAVRSFQARNGIRADGVVGPQTALALGVYYS